ncbi:nuclease-related domain-containing protein [Ammoniphilus sp. YIM 78166]|uniref:nuclease-related domain-containing protein n=1 Tax=Ammoniphilus sp. YIM 78166 TaxID=1644106 RepID=UPI001431F2FD|nr:nuclease-related domain-containing protein [Ammoniphilus sp. YIM 78166]
MELRILRSLNARMELTPNDQTYFSNLEKGFRGEQEFDKWIESLANSRLILHDLLLEYNHTLLQVDSFVIDMDKVYLFEVKNFEGDYYIEEDRWHSLSKNEIKNPLLQLQRNESLMRRLLQDLGFPFPIMSYVIFINPEFHLYNCPPNLSIIFPTQLQRFIGRLAKSPSILKDTHSNLAAKLLSTHLTDSPYSRLPKYHFDQLKKGIPCPHCKRMYSSIIKNALVCHSCNTLEPYHHAILRNVEEYRMLFPHLKLTTNQNTYLV